MTVTRRQLVAAGLAGGGLASGALAGGALTARPVLAQSGPGGDVAQLERLLALEARLESAYRAALARDAIEPTLGRTLLAHEREHVRGLEIGLANLGRRRADAGTAAPPRAAALAGRRAFAEFALGLERRAVTAYVETLATLGSPGLLQPLGSIMAAGAQHEVALRQVLGEQPLGGGVP